MLVSLCWIYTKSAHHTHREPSMAFTIPTLFSTQPRTHWKDTLPRDHEQFCLIRMPIKATCELSTSWLHFALLKGFIISGKTPDSRSGLELD